MEVLLYIIPLSLALALIALAGFFWALKNNQFDDNIGNAERILRDDENDAE
ncbi:MAG: cbb3-type cytochrome oxidase assembly protein CcoS [Pseudomonadota bacterium]